MTDVRPGPLILLRKLSARARARGPAEVATLARDRLREAVDSCDELLIFSRETGGTSPEAEGLSFRQARPEDGAAYARDIGTDSPVTFRARLSSYTRCFLVASDGRLLHATWMTTASAWTREIRAYLSPPPGHAYVYESFTRADTRGRGVYPFALESIVVRLAEESIGRVWVGVEAHNPASIKAVSKAGFEQSFVINYCRRWGRLSLEVGHPDDHSGPRLAVTRHV